MHSKFLSVMLMALVLVVACAAMPGAITGETITGQPITIMPNTTNIPKRISTYAMGCRSFDYVKVCISQDPNQLKMASEFREVNDHFRYNLPKNKKYTSYEFCFGTSCAAMTTLSGSEFYPKNYENVANLAVNELNRNKACYDFPWVEYYPSSVDVYIYDLNFVFSWWFNDSAYVKCGYNGGPRSVQ